MNAEQVTVCNIVLPWIYEGAHINVCNKMRIACNRFSLA
jgi:hypothetical protein